MVLLACPITLAERGLHWKKAVREVLLKLYHKKFCRVSPIGSPRRQSNIRQHLQLKWHAKCIPDH